jgi:hypothetical protein
LSTYSGAHKFVGVYDCFCREELVLKGAQEGNHISSTPCVHGGAGGLFSSTSPDVKSVWSFNEKRDSIEGEL